MLVEQSLLADAALTDRPCNPESMTVDDTRSTAHAQGAWPAKLFRGVRKGPAAASPAQLEATADLNVHKAAREEGGAKPGEPETWGHYHMSRGKSPVEYLADRH